jgi:molybdopterin-guanine dinucleotide biosynthesis protein A
MLDVVGCILCGGGGRRMGGAEKPLTRLHDTPLVQHVRTRLAPQVSRVIISANREHARYAQWGDTVVTDDTFDGGPSYGEPTHGGPLYGVLAVLRHVLHEPHASARLLFCCPGDAPMLDRTLVARLRDAMDSTDADVGYPHDGERAQYLFVLLRVSDALAASLDDYLASDERSVHGWLERCRSTSVDASDIASSFANVNTPQELADLAKHAGHSPSAHASRGATG